MSGGVEGSLEALLGCPWEEGKEVWGFKIGQILEPGISFIYIYDPQLGVGGIALHFPPVMWDH